MDDVPEEKCSADGLGLIEMMPAVRVALMSLRLYLIAVMLLATYRLVSAGIVVLHHTH
jgi:hypothetical protein